MPRKQLVWIFASIALILAIVVLYQQRTIQSNSSVKSVRQQAIEQQIIDDTITSETGSLVEQLTGDSNTGDIATGSITTEVIISNQDGCVTSYQALLDRVIGLGEVSDSDAGQALADMVGLGYCNGSTPKESDFLSINSNGQTLSYDISSGGTLSLDNKSVVPDFVTNCSGNDCPTVQALRSVRDDNKYIVLETTQARSYQSSFRLISTTNGVTMLFWSALNFVDPMLSYVWTDEGQFIFIASIGRETHTYIVQSKSFPTSSIIADESDTPIAVSANGDILTVLYDRNPSNTDMTDRYTKSYEIATLGQDVTTGTGTAQ